MNVTQEVKRLRMEINNTHLVPLQRSRQPWIEDPRTLIFEGYNSVKGLMQALSAQGIHELQRIEFERVDSVVLDLRFRPPYGERTKMTVRTISANPVDRILWISAEVTGVEPSGSLHAEVPACAGQAFGFDDFWGRVSQQVNFRVVPKLQESSVAEPRPIFS